MKKKKGETKYTDIVAGILDQEIPNTEETSVVDTPVEETPVEETPVEDTPVEDTPTDKPPVEDTPVEETPTEEPPADKPPVEDTPVEETPASESLPADLADIDSQIEKELGIINKSQDVVADIQRQVKTDDSIKNSKSFKDIQSKLKEVNDNLQDRESELEESQGQLKRYKKRLGELSSEVADRSMSEITQKPIIETLNDNENLKGAVLALNRAKETGDEAYTSEALNKIYDFIQKEANIDVRKLISQQQDTELGAMGAGESSAGVSVVDRGADGDKTKRIVDNILS